MRSLLNNPWAVAILCGIALGIISWNLIPEGTANVEQREAKPDPVASLDRGPSYDIALLNWDDSISRDPFRAFDAAQIAIAQIGRKGPTPNGATPHRISVTPPEAVFNLEAISMQPGERMAAINGMMVVEGESIEGYRVADIGSDGVWLESPLGRTQVTFPEEENHIDGDEDHE